MIRFQRIRAHLAFADLASFDRYLVGIFGVGRETGNYHPVPLDVDFAARKIVDDRHVRLLAHDPILACPA